MGNPSNDNQEMANRNPRDDAASLASQANVANGVKRSRIRLLRSSEHAAVNSTAVRRHLLKYTFVTNPPPFLLLTGQNDVSVTDAEQ